MDARKFLRKIARSPYIIVAVLLALGIPPSVVATLLHLPESGVVVEGSESQLYPLGTD